VNGKRIFARPCLLAFFASALCIAVPAQVATSSATPATKSTSATLPSETPDQIAAKLPQPTGYVSDLANVIDASSQEQIEQLCSQLDKQAHAQIAIVTLNSLGGNSIEQMSTAIYDKWKIGSKATDKGILMVFAIQDHKRRIEVGPGLQGILNDAKVGDIGRSMVPQLKEAQYGPAIFGGVQQLANYIAADAGVTLTQPQPPQQQAYPRQSHSQGMSIFSILRIIIFIVILFSAIAGRGRGGNGWLWLLLGNMMGGGGGGGRDRDSFGGGGGSGGGGDGGGGFGGFGGGGSDGGGASGDW
jgi:uncharacterized protein